MDRGGFRLLLSRLTFSLLAVLLFGLGTVRLRFDRSLYYLSIGLLANTLPPTKRPDPRLTLVALDDETLEDPRLPFWAPRLLNRRAHARLLREIAAGGASLIGFDIAFLGESPDDGRRPGLSPDAELRAALDAGPPVVLVTEARARQPGEPASRFLAPAPALSGSPRVRLSSPLVRRVAATGQVFGAQLEQSLPDGRTLNAFAFECYKAAMRQDDLAASHRYEAVGPEAIMVARWPGRPVERAFRTISYREVWDGSWRRRDPELFRGRTVLVGSFSRLGSADVVATPLGSLPGVLVHAVLLQTLLDHAWVPDGSRLPTWLLTALAAVGVVLALFRFRPLGALVAITGIAGASFGACVVAFRLGYWIGPLQPLLAVGSFSMLGFAWRSGSFRGMLDRFAGAEAAGQLAALGRLQTRTRRATLFFADVRAYTDLSARLSPVELMDVLNEHYRWIDGIVERHGGRVDKHIGDAMMAVFDRGADAVHARAALAAAEEAVRTAGRRQGPAACLEFGIGIHTGEVTSGTLGKVKQEYGSVGDAVNVAARLEQLTRDLAVPALFSEATVRLAGAEERLRHLDTVTLKGRAEPVTVYTLPA